MLFATKGKLSIEVFNTTLTGFISAAKTAGLSKLATTAYVTSSISVGSASKELGIPFTAEQLNTVALSMHNVSSASIQSATDLVDHTIATAIQNDKTGELIKLTREAAIEHLRLAGTLSATQIAEADYGKAITKTQTEMLAGISIVNDMAVRWNTSLAAIGYSFESLTTAGATLTTVFGELKNAVDFLDKVHKASLSPEVYASGNTRVAEATFQSSLKPFNREGASIEDYHAFVRSGEYDRLFAFAAGLKDPGLLRDVEKLGTAGSNYATTLITSQQETERAAADAESARNKAASEANTEAEKAAANAKSYAGIVKGINDQLEGFGKTDIAKQLLAVSTQIKDLVESAAEVGGTLSNLPELRKGLTMEILKPLITEANDSGKTEVQKSIATVATWRAEMLASAAEIATGSGIAVTAVQDYINVIADSRLDTVYKTAADGLRSFKLSITDFAYSLNTTKLGTFQSQYNLIVEHAKATYAKAASGDPTAMGQVVGEANSVISAIESRFGSNSDVGQGMITYVRDQMQLLGDIPSVNDIMLATNQAQLEVLKALPQNLANALSGNPLTVIPSPQAVPTAVAAILTTSTTSTASVDVLVVELQALKKELREIKENQVKQTVALMDNEITVANATQSVIMKATNVTASNTEFAKKLTIAIR
jgi:hypothetical protein